MFDRRRGSVKRKLAPPSGFGSAQIRPRCASTIARLTERPTPVPLGLVVYDNENMRSVSTSPSPIPLSPTSIRTSLPLCDDRIQTFGLQDRSEAFADHIGRE